MKLWAMVVAAVALYGPRAYANGEAVNGFPNWQERVMHEWTNRARCGCGPDPGDRQA